MKAWLERNSHIIFAAIGVLLIAIGLWGVNTSTKALQKASQAAEASTTNTHKLDRNYQRWDEFAKANPNVKVPPQKNGEHKQ